MQCNCGYVFNLSEVPCPDEYSILPETTIEQAIMKLEEGACTGQELLILLDKDRQSVLICENCGRLYLEDRVKSNYYRAFKPEDQN